MSHEDTLILEIDADVYAKIAAIAAREGTDIDRMIRDMVRESIAEAEAQKSPDRTDTPGFRRPPAGAALGIPGIQNELRDKPKERRRRAHSQDDGQEETPNRVRSC